MQILVFNSGSSSLNYKIYHASGKSLEPIIHGKAHRVGVISTQSSFIEHWVDGKQYQFQVELQDHRLASRYILEFLESMSIKVDAIGHRFVHGGILFKNSVLITSETQSRLEACLPLAPIHNPNSLAIIHVCHEKMPGIPQYVTFDTAFHSNFSPESFTYSLPAALREEFGYRKFGFHGLSYAYVTSTVSRVLKDQNNKLKMVICHLGTGGSSMMAYANGASIETSMGYSPLSGLVMSTRTGDLDPLIPIYLLESNNETPEHLVHLFNKKSGILGVSGFSSDLRDVQKRIDEDDYQPAKLAESMVIYRIRKYLGAFSFLLNGLDVLVFTDDIGAHNWQLREKVCQNMEWLGIELNSEINRQSDPLQISFVNSKLSRVKVIAMPTDEEWMIANEGNQLFAREYYADI